MIVNFTPTFTGVFPVANFARPGAAVVRCHTAVPHTLVGIIGAIAPVVALHLFATAFATLLILATVVAFVFEGIAIAVGVTIFAASALPVFALTGAVAHQSPVLAIVAFTFVVSTALGAIGLITFLANTHIHIPSGQANLAG